jgi:hypothetical protein
VTPSSASECGVTRTRVLLCRLQDAVVRARDVTVRLPAASATVNLEGKPGEAGEVIGCECQVELDASKAFMLDCDSCHRWFHGICVGVDESDADSVVFMCDQCQVRKQFVLQSERMLKFAADAAAEEAAESAVSPGAAGGATPPRATAAAAEAGGDAAMNGSKSGDATAADGDVVMDGTAAATKKKRGRGRPPKIKKAPTGGDMADVPTPGPLSPLSPSPRPAAPGYVLCLCSHS